MRRTIIAIDPGASGGVAVQVEDAFLETAYGMWETEGDIAEGLRMLKAGSHNQPVAFIEENTGFCGVRIPSHTMFKLGRNTGFLHGCLHTLGFRIEAVRPQEWQKELGLGTSKGLSKVEWKNKLKARAQQLYPHLKVTLQTSDALLILEYGKRKTLA